MRHIHSTLTFASCFSCLFQSSIAIAVTNASSASSTVSLNILSKTGLKNDTAPNLYGWMFEDINHSGDGGIYGELLVNRGFEGSSSQWGTVPGYTSNSIISQENSVQAFGPVLVGYQSVGPTKLRLDTLRPLSYSHQWVLALDIPTTAPASQVGFENLGWWGIPVIPQTYNVSFYIYPDQTRNYAVPSTNITVSLRSNTTGQVWASTVIPAQNWNVVNWTYVEAQIICDVTAPDANNTFALTFDGAEAAGQTYFFSLVSLFGETYKGYKNGLRKDLGEVIANHGAKFLRWPGGNNLEGYSIQRRWKWWETIGPLAERWARPGNWNYYNTNGLGLLEFLEWSESMNMKNILGIYSGYSLGNGVQTPGNLFPATAEAMYPLLKEALDELEFCTGDISTPWGAKRAEYGHPDPFEIQYVEIGNEDWFSSEYAFRFKYLYDGLSAAYPNMTIISSAYNENADYEISLPPGSIWDTHHYEEPEYFLNNFDFYDNWQERTNNTDVGVFIGEYSAIQIDTPTGIVDFTFPQGIHIFYPSMEAAIAEAVYILGAERNPNVVKLSAYAPSLQNLNWYNWTPNLVAFDADPNNTILSVSYWMQLILNRFHGSKSLTVTNIEGDFRPLYWAASEDESGTAIFLKIINTNGTSQPLKVSLESTWTTVNGTTISNADPLGFNYKNNQTAIQPLAVTFADNSTVLAASNSSSSSSSSGDGGVWSWDVPAYSINVLQFNL